MPQLTVVTVRYPFFYPRVFIAYGPGLTLREDAHWRNWRKWNGIGFRLSGNRVCWCEVRKVPRRNDRLPRP